MPRMSRSKRLTACKNKTYYAKKKKEVQENCEPARLTTPLNDISLNSPLKPRTINEDVLQPSFDDPKDMQISAHNELSSPLATPRSSPVPPNLFPDESHLLISPSTGLLRSRGNIVDGPLIYSTPLKNSQGSTNHKSNDSFTDTPYEEVWLESPQPTAAATELLLNTQPAPDKSADKVFTVSSMCVVDTATSGIYPRTPIEKPLNAKTPPSTSNISTYQRIILSLSVQLPSPWIVAPNSNTTCFFILMLASDEMWGVIQRFARLSTDGTVQLEVHGRAISLAHPIWEDFPGRVCLTDQESMDEFLKYVLEIVNVIRSYEVCMAIHEAHYFKLASKRKGLVLETGCKESRYNETYRPEKCELLLSTKIKVRKYCNTCWKVRRDIKRQSRNKNSEKSPHANTRITNMDTGQRLYRFKKVSRDLKITKQKEEYYRKKSAQLIAKYGVTTDEKINRDLRGILDEHFQSLDKNSDQEKNALHRIFIEQQLKASKVKGPTGMRWHPVILRLALQIFTTSPAAYDAIADTGIITLPSSKTLFNYSHINVPKQGICGPALKMLVDDLKEYPEDHHKRYFMLLMDEMSISQNLVYSRATGELSGFVHLHEVQEEIKDLETAMQSKEDLPAACYGTQAEAVLRKQSRQEFKEYGTELPSLSKKMLTYMVVGITSGIKLVVASYGVGNSTSAPTLSSLTWGVVEALEERDICVLGLVCDGHPSNRRFIKMHVPITKLQSKTVFDTLNRVYPERPFYFFSDVPHLLKTMRNCFYNSEWGSKTRLLKKNGQFITWRTIVDLYDHEKNNPLRMAHKLNAQVVFLNSYSQMKVSYAARVFSKTVANTIEATFKGQGKEETVKFITMVNDFFDCLNGAAILHGVHKKNHLLQPYRVVPHHRNAPEGNLQRPGEVNDARFSMLMKFNNYLQDWKKEAPNENARMSDPTVIGVEMTVHSFINCVKFMLLKKGAPFVLARSFCCQDPLEQHFSKQRAACGGSTNPNMNKFLRNGLKFLNIRELGFRRSRGNTQAVREAGYADRISAPLLKRKRSQQTAERVSIARRAILASCTPPRR